MELTRETNCVECESFNLGTIHHHQYTRLMMPEELDQSYSVEVYKYQCQDCGHEWLDTEECEGEVN